MVALLVAEPEEEWSITREQTSLSRIKRLDRFVPTCPALGSSSKGSVMQFRFTGKVNGLDAWWVGEAEILHYFNIN